MEDRFVSIKWFGNIDKKKKKYLKFNPILPTPNGICSWLAPLPKEDDSDLFTWPTGVVSGANNGLELILDVESYDYGQQEDDEEVGFKIAVAHPLDIPIIEQKGDL